MLVVVLLRGAADGLSIAVPHGSPEYYAVRKQIAIQPPSGGSGKARSGKAAARALPLTPEFGLHPRLAKLLPAWQAKELSLIVGFGSPDPSRSHFEAQDRMELGIAKVPGAPASPDSGWLNRLAQGLGLSAPLGAVAFAPSLPMILRGVAPSISLEASQAYGIGAPEARRAALEGGFERLYARAAALHPRERVGGAGVSGLRALAELRALPRSKAEGNYPRGNFGAGLSDLARLIKSNSGLRLGFVELGGWDTHTGQGDGDSGRLARSLTELGGGLAAFREDLGDAQARVVTLVMTEFGRTVAQNGTGGTDHGHGGAALLLGGSIAGGQVLGSWPGLAREDLYQGRDLAVTTDYRDVVAQIAQRQFGSGATRQLFPGHTVSTKLQIFG